MMVRKFLAWAANAAPSDRAAAAASLARACLDRDLPPDDLAQADLALVTLADDPSPLVRQALAVELAARPDAPLHLVLSLAGDVSSISEPVLRLSPALRDGDLVDRLADGDPLVQSAIAMRERVSVPVSAALAEIARADAVIALLCNEGADVPDFALDRIFERFGDDGRVREALLARPDLPGGLRAALVDAAASALEDFVSAAGWLDPRRAVRTVREAREKGAAIVAAEAPDAPALVRAFRARGRLTPALILRAALGGDRAFVASVLAELADVQPARAQACLQDWRGGAFAALVSRAGLPDAMVPVLRAALAAQRACDLWDEAPTGALRRPLVEAAAEACERLGEAAAPLSALLGRFLVEAAREDARAFADWLARDEILSAIAPAEDAPGIVEPALEAQGPEENQPAPDSPPQPRQSPEKAAPVLRLEPSASDLVLAIPVVQPYLPASWALAPEVPPASRAA